MREYFTELWENLLEDVEDITDEFKEHPLFYISLIIMVILINIALHT